MTTVEVNQDTDVIVLPEDDAAPVVVISASETEVIESSDQGPPGPIGPHGDQGIQGEQGIPGNTVLYGPVDPVNAVGINGNFYINTITNFMFGPKAGGVWPAGTSMVGPQGIQGIQGITGNTGAQGPISKGTLWGLTLSMTGASATFGIAAGECANTTNATLMVLASAYTKTTGAWAVGSGNGALDTSTIAINTWYYVYLIKRNDTNVVDVCISTSPTTPTFGSNIPSQYSSWFRRIGAMATNASSQWTKFWQTGDLFTWDTPKADIVNGGAPGGTGTGYNLSLPTAIFVEANLIVVFNSSITQCGLLLQPPFLPNQQAGTPVGNYQLINPAASVTVSAQFQLPTLTGAFRATSFGGGTQSVYVNTLGWVDKRGRLE